jgi:Protein of unknown function (DUF992)
MTRLSIFAMLVVALVASASAAQAATEIGVLECRGGPRLGLIVGSFHRMDCIYRPKNGAVQHYTATGGRIGLDVGITGKSVVVWSVFAPSQDLAPGTLAGKYGGISGDAALGLGVGANALIGGSARSIALQPFSVKGQVGVSLAAGVTGVTLKYRH